jgi:hypothetical protein
MLILFIQVEFLRDLLAAWSNELSKKEPLLTKKDCLTVLGLEDMNLAEMDETFTFFAHNLWRSI